MTGGGAILVFAFGAAVYGFGLASLAAYAVDKQGGIRVLACLFLMGVGAALAYSGVIA